MSIDHVLQKLYDIKQNISFLQSQEKDIKDKIHRVMTDKETNRLVGKNLICTRSVRTTRNITKNNVPDEFWVEYSTSKRYPVLTLKML